MRVSLESGADRMEVGYSGVDDERVATERRKEVKIVETDLDK